MKKFILGFIIGIFLMLNIKFLFPVDPAFRIHTGRLLDTDIVYLKNGAILKGWIVQESGQDLYLEVEKGYITLSSTDYNRIEKNYLSRYIREIL